METIVADLMNHGYSETQAQRFIGKCFIAYMNMDPAKRKELEEKYASSHNEKSGN